jgi:hypothetical protein
MISRYSQPKYFNFTFARGPQAEHDKILCWNGTVIVQLHS